MKRGFYPRLARDGMRKNARLYKPFLLTCTGMVMMLYIICFLADSRVLAAMPGSDILNLSFRLGSFVIAVFSTVFLFYTNSFLMRRRRAEFGLYNILGMDRCSISRILLWETLITAAISLAAGLFFGIVFSKLAELGIARMLGGAVTFDMYISIHSIVFTIAVFAVIFLLLLANSVLRLRLSSPIELLRSESLGEKPPRANWVLGVLGVAVLATAYFIAVTTADPLEAMLWFFVAVIMVIVATYLLFISGSVVLCRMLQKNRRYYYRANHFVSVSSMVYRMKRNGAGLASICILATMVLVMISSTTSLFFGSEDSLRSQYPREINLLASFSAPPTEDQTDRLRRSVLSICRENNVTLLNVIDYRYYNFTGVLINGELRFDPGRAYDFDPSTVDKLFDVTVISYEDYLAMGEQARELHDGEALVYSYRSQLTPDVIRSGDKKVRVAEVLDSFNVSLAESQSVLPTMYIIVPDYETLVSGMQNEAVQPRWRFAFDTDVDAAEQSAIGSQLREMLRDENIDDSIYGYSVGIREDNRADFYTSYGSLFLLGGILSIVFIAAAVLIIYYKQISEGYEDKKRFEVMQNVGMTKREIRRSINSQLLTVFFLPLIGAAMHLGFAFPMIRRLLLLFNLSNIRLFALTTAISFCVFAVFYTIVYRRTSSVYYRIVSGGEDR